MDAALTVICAWCGKVVSPGTTGQVSHGICIDCARGILARLPKHFLEAIADEDGSVSLFTGEPIPRSSWPSGLG